jgi:16S rRNA (cytosine1402-N4)-methyltransferase
MMNRAETYHEPVMVHEVLEYLSPRTGTIVDATVGGGGHARAILDSLAGDASGSSRLLGIDKDPEAIASAGRQLSSFDNMELVHASYTDMSALVRRFGFTSVTGVLFDFGVSLHQLATPARGFSFDAEGPVDMRFDQTGTEPTALELVRRTPERELRDWLRAYGEEPMSGRVARVIHERRREIATTRDLADAVRRAVPARYVRNTLARVFQALRIATNRELENVRRGLEVALDMLVPGGRLVVLSYHSLEDRVAKGTLRAGAEAGRLRVLTKKPLRPTPAEVARNPRSRSARLRAAEVA